MGPASSSPARGVGATGSERPVTALGTYAFREVSKMLVNPTATILGSLYAFFARRAFLFPPS